MTLKRVLSAILSATMLTTGVVCTASAAEVQTESSDAVVKAELSGNDYGLLDNIQDGVIFHAFCWKYNDITDMLPEIAKAGFTSVQTSPPQPTAGTGAWWWFYQPRGFYIGTSEMGTKEDYTRLCTEAEKYGVKVIADVVANHLAGDHSNIQDDLKDSQYWHTDIGSANDGDRYSVTHGTIGMPDLNTEHSYVQECVKKYIEELKGVGVDGIRFDAAKHIGLPSEGDNFWPTVTSVSGLWYYGEILNNPGIDANSDQGKSVLKEYSQYMTITDSTYGMNLRNSFNSGTAPSSYGNWVATCLTSDKLLYWGESHDTWSNNKDWGYSNEISQNNIDRAYAVAASRNQITALYFSRPSTAVKDDIKIGAKGSTHFTAPEVAAVNHFHNAMNGQADYYTTGSNCSVVCREKGAVIVAGSGGNMDVSVPNGGSTTAPGTYTDEITGNVWTVTSSTISGKIGDTGIAVIYNPDDNDDTTASVSASPSESSFTTDTLTVTLSVKGASTGTYTTSEGASGTYSDGDKITIGDKTTVTGTSKQITITLNAIGEDGKEVLKTFTYTKSDPNAKTYIYFDNSSYNWSNVYAYVYDQSSGTAKEMAAWPGVKMTDIDSSTGFYMLDVESMKNGQVIFSDGTGASDKRYPADMEPGMSIGGSSKLFSAGNSWTDYYEPTPVPDPDPDPDPDPEPTIPFIMGDANQDGKVSLRDATMVLKHVASVSTLSDVAFFAADVDESLSITTSDSVAIQRYNVGYSYTNSYGRSIGSILEIVAN